MESCTTSGSGIFIALKKGGAIFAVVQHNLLHEEGKLPYASPQRLRVGVSW